jgi:predicted DsbA family dithiol-disulfide isomerase
MLSRHRLQEKEGRVLKLVSGVVMIGLGVYIGKRRLEAALAERGRGSAATVRWHPFQLNPELPRGGVDRRSYLERKFGGPEGVREVYARVDAAGREAGLWFEFERIERQPNTLDAQRLIAWGQKLMPAKVAGLVEHLFRSYFTQGVDIGNVAELARIAGLAGYDAYRATALLTSDEGRAAVSAADQRARAMGVGGVPLFIFNQRIAVSGAQPPKALLEAMLQSEAAVITR